MYQESALFASTSSVTRKRMGKGRKYEEIRKIVARTSKYEISIKFKNQTRRVMIRQILELRPLLLTSIKFYCLTLCRHLSACLFNFYSLSLSLSLSLLLTVCLSACLSPSFSLSLTKSPSHSSFTFQALKYVIERSLHATSHFNHRLRHALFRAFQYHLIVDLK